MAVVFIISSSSAVVLRAVSATVITMRHGFDDNAAKKIETVVEEVKSKRSCAKYALRSFNIVEASVGQAQCC